MNSDHKIKRPSQNGLRILRESFGSRLYLVSSIAMSGIALASLVMAFQYLSKGAVGIAAMLVILACTVSPILSAIGHWRLYLQKTGDLSADIKRTRAFSSLCTTVTALGIVLQPVVGAVLLFCAVLMNLTPSWAKNLIQCLEEWTDSLWETLVKASELNLAVLLIGGIFLIVLLTAAFVYWWKTYTSLSKYLSSLKRYTEKGVYRAKKPATVLFYVYTAFTLLIAVLLAIRYGFVNTVGLLIASVCIGVYLVVSARLTEELHGKLSAETAESNESKPTSGSRSK